MNLTGILAIGGYPGLFKMISQMKSGLVVESIVDGKRMPAYATSKILALEDISIYTDEEDVPLGEVFALIYKKTGGKTAIDPKKASAKELGDYLASVLPTYDRDRVYQSDMKKLFQWFNLMVEKGLLEEEKKEEKKGEGKAAAPKSAKQEKAETPKPKSEPKGKKGSTKKVKK